MMQVGRALPSRLWGPSRFLAGLPDAVSLRVWIWRTGGGADSLLDMSRAQHRQDRQL